MSAQTKIELGLALTFRAACSCGWQGERRLERSEAEVDAEYHDFGCVVVRKGSRPAVPVNQDGQPYRILEGT